MGAAQIRGVASSVYAPKAGKPHLRGMRLEIAVGGHLSSLRSSSLTGTDSAIGLSAR